MRKEQPRRGPRKTVACKRYSADSPNVWPATMSPGTETLYACLRRVAAACGLQPGNSGSAQLEEELPSASRTPARCWPWTRRST